MRFRAEGATEPLALGQVFSFLLNRGPSRFCSVPFGLDTMIKSRSVLFSRVSLTFTVKRLLKRLNASKMTVSWS
jgi:hypothetical protein